ncbi:MAG: FAD-dependent thymidylate synthase [Acidimicrobiia bacterium]|nr:FAD-dependent thymidylate synthase [Acidimicrobiia bacterium]
MSYHQESFTSEEEAVLERFFSNTDRPVFALMNMPEVVKGALFARYSRSPKSIRRLFLDEFMADPDTGIASIARQVAGDDPHVNLRKAETLYQRVFFEYGDDSVAQLGGTHLACEQASNILTKVLEWGRLAAYLEQSTRYIYYDVRLGDRYRYHVPGELVGTPLGSEYLALMENLFDTYSQVVAAMTSAYERRFPRQESDSNAVYASTIRAKACDAARGLLPAATLSNVGVYATGQAYEMALVRMQSHPLFEVRSYGEMMLTELRKVIPSFLTRVDRPDRGLRWSSYLADNVVALTELVPEPGSVEDRGPSVELTDWDPDAELKVAAAALYAVSELSDRRLMELAAAMSVDERHRVIAALIGARENRRHKPSRAMERTAYRFDVVCDFGAFRDLQRHRMLTIEWQKLSTRLGFDRPDDIVEEGFGSRWDDMMGATSRMYERIRSELGPDVAQYVVPFAYNLRFVMEMNPREAFHLVELRSQPAGHVAYRRIAQEMHRQIRDVAGHTAIADAMKFVDYSDVGLERLESERRAEQRRIRS